MPLRRLFSYFALALLALPGLAAAQTTGVIRGRVTDAANGASLAGVQVRIEGTKLGTLSGSDSSLLSSRSTAPERRIQSAASASSCFLPARVRQPLRILF